MYLENFTAIANSSIKYMDRLTNFLHLLVKNTGFSMDYYKEVHPYKHRQSAIQSYHQIS